MASQKLAYAGSKDGAVGMVVGSRAHLEDAAIATRHWYRNFLMRGFHLLVLFVAGGSVRDTQCGFKVFYFLTTCYMISGSPCTRWALSQAQSVCCISFWIKCK